jgi:hypothetical protein
VYYVWFSKILVHIYLWKKKKIIFADAVFSNKILPIIIIIEDSQKNIIIIDILLLLNEFAKSFAMVYTIM